MSKKSPAAYADLRVANATLDAAEDRAEALEREMEALRRERDENEQAHLAEELRALRENADLKARAEALREALRPVLAKVPRSLRAFPEAAAKWQEVGPALRQHWADECELMAVEVEALGALADARTDLKEQP